LVIKDPTTVHTLNVLLHHLVKYMCSRNRHAQELSELQQTAVEDSNCHARFSRSNSCWKSIRLEMWAIHWRIYIHSMHPRTIKAKFHYAILIVDRFEAGGRPAASWNLAYHLAR